MFKRFSRYLSSIIQTVKNRNLPIETRTSIMYISTGLVAAFLGFFLTILCHASIGGTIAVIIIAIMAMIFLYVGFKRSDMNFIRNMMIISLLFLIPTVFITSGGNTSGCPAWFIYQLYFINLSCSGWMFYVYLPIALLTDISLCILDYVGWSQIYHLQTERDIFVSSLGSWSIICAAILFSVVAYKKMFNEERESLVEKTEELEKANEFEKMFLANMSHELRTPINAIIGFNEMIQRKTNSDQVLTYAGNIDVASKHLVSLVNDILDLSKLEAGKITLNLSNYEVTEGTQKAYDIVRKLAENKNLPLIVNLSPNIPKVMYGDKERLVQMSLNLLTNAIKYTEAGEVILTLTSRPDDEDPNIEWFSISVKDTGMGIAPENQEKIFNAYRRVDGKVSEIEGTGLGLAITKNFAEIMGGTITLDSKVGVGSTFTITVPQTVVDRTPTGEFHVLEDTPYQQKSAGSIVKKLGKDTTILVVDDTVMNLEVIRSLLEESQADIITVTSGARAIQCVTKRKVDIIFMDIMMPQMSGIEAMHEIKKITPDVPIIALTANAISGAREEYLNEGFDNYLSKPVRPKELEEMLNSYF